MIEKMYKARSTTQNAYCWPTYKGFGVTAKWTFAYIDQRLRKRKLENLKPELKNL